MQCQAPFRRMADLDPPDRRRALERAGHAADLLAARRDDGRAHGTRRRSVTPGSRRSPTQPVLRLHASHVYVNARLLAEVIALIPGGAAERGPARAPAGAAPRAIPAPLASWRGGRADAPRSSRGSWWHEPSWAPWRRAARLRRGVARVRARFAESARRAAPDANRTRSPRRDRAHAASELGGYLARRELGDGLRVRLLPSDERARAALGARSRCRARRAHRRLAGYGLTRRRTAIWSALGRRLRADASLAAAACRRDVGRSRERALAAIAPASVGAFRRFIAHARPSPDRTRPAPPDLRGAPAIALQLAWRAGDATPDFERTRAERRARATAAIEHAVGRGAGRDVPPRRLPRRASPPPSATTSSARTCATTPTSSWRGCATLALGLGAHLAARGIVAAADDVCFLRARRDRDGARRRRVARRRRRRAARRVRGRRRRATARDPRRPPATDAAPAAAPRRAPRRDRRPGTLHGAGARRPRRRRLRRASSAATSSSRATPTRDGRRSSSSPPGSCSSRAASSRTARSSRASSASRRSWTSPTRRARSAAATPSSSTRRRERCGSSRELDGDAAPPHGRLVISPVLKLRTPFCSAYTSRISNCPASAPPGKKLWPLSLHE